MERNHNYSFHPWVICSTNTFLIFCLVRLPLPNKLRYTLDNLANDMLTKAASATKKNDTKEEEIITPSPSKKKKKKNKKKNKKKTSQTISNAEQREFAEPKKASKKVQFENVHVREYRRCIGTDGVPCDGGWPLGLSNEVVREYNVIGGIEEFEQQKQMELRRRWDKFVSKHSGRNNSDGLDSVEERCFETRQLDFKKSNKGHNGDNGNNHLIGDGKNPLFKPSDEDDRKKMIMRDYCITLEEIQKGFAEEEPSSHHPTEHHSDHDNKDHHKHHKHKKDKKSTKRTTRSSSETCEYEGTPFDPFDIRHIRNDLEQIRNNRSAAFTGCSCRKPHFFLPFYTAHKEASSPTNGGGSSNGGKHKHKKDHKLPDRKLKEELRKRGKLKPNQSRAEMEIELGNAIEKQGCCTSDDCECVKNGIECQADSCSCWYPQHQSISHGHHAPVTELPSPEEMEAGCGNKNGIYIVKFGEIHNYRNTVLCQEIGKDASL